MADRIIDKIIMLMALGALFVVSGLSTTRMVVAILLVLFFAFLTELFKHDIFLIICGAVVAAGAFISKEAFVIYSFPVFVYAFASGKDAFSRKKEITKKEWIILITEVILTLLMVALSITNISVLIIFFPTILLGIRTSYQTNKQEELSARLDDARYDAIDTARKRREDREKEEEKIYLATLEERNRIAREIHDNIGHMLTRTLVQMEAIKIVNQDPAVAPHLDSVSDTLNDAMTAVRKSVHELHNESIDLSIGINEVVKTLPPKFTYKVNTMIESAVPNDCKNTVLAILKEAITNIVKYSNGDKVKVEFIENTTFWRLLIEDNGKNKDFTFDPYSNNGGIGLSNIASRCEEIGGRANISADHTGFRVRVTIPRVSQEESK